jgi:hypothetical protein
VRIGAGVQGSEDASADLVVVGELGEVLVAEVGGAVQLLPRDEAQDLGVLAPSPEVDRRSFVVIGWLGFHELMVVGGAGGSLSIEWSAE